MHKNETIKWRLAKDQIEAAKIIGQNISADLAVWADVPILLLLSGGSALNILEYIETENWSNITLFFLDERYSVDNTDSNFAQLAQFDWLTKVTGLGAKYIDSRVLSGEDLDSFTKRLNSSLKNWLDTNLAGKKLAIMGMGPDGHVAGIFPYPENPVLFAKLFTGKEIMVSHNVYGKNKFPQRVTTTFSFFDLLDRSYVCICGEEKRKALTELSRKKLPKHELPAGILYNIKDVFLVTDIDIK